MMPPEPDEETNEAVPADDPDAPEDEALIASAEEPEETEPDGE